MQNLVPKPSSFTVLLGGGVVAQRLWHFMFALCEWHSVSVMPSITLLMLNYVFLFLSGMKPKLLLQKLMIRSAEDCFIELIWCVMDGRVCRSMLCLFWNAWCFSKNFRCWISLYFRFLVFSVLLLRVAVMLGTEVVSKVDV